VTLTSLSGAGATDLYVATSLDALRAADWTWVSRARASTVNHISVFAEEAAGASAGLFVRFANGNDEH